MNGCAVTVVAVLSAIYAIISITLGVLGQSTITAAVGAIVNIDLIIVYLVGAAKLSKAVGSGSETGARVVALTRQVASVVALGVFVALAWTALGNSAPMPVQMILANLVIPVQIIMNPLLLLRFIRRSFERQGARIKSRAASKKRAGTKSTASVSPATDFAESSTNGKSATDV